MSGSHVPDGKKGAVAQKTVAIPGRGAVFVLQPNANPLDSGQAASMDAMNIIDSQTTISS
ncbi:LpqN/LpqT family lipoprotein [Mycobacterium malmoense]|uniref:LpqN/LpqT family lipoprotein n=1 Tax=Mycobacterium malmoense TaxID=1780 RepID=UPI001E51CED0|nr:LpqN/LpqT family lipoprotein [Mycobacterium malmoense]